MNVVLATDDNFVQHCAVTIVSVLRNNTCPVNFFLLTENLTSENEALLKEMVKPYDCNLNFVIVNAEMLKKCPMPRAKGLSHISIATYYRLFIPTLLDDSIEKVLYLDCDIVVRKSLTALWEISVENMAIAAVNQITDWNVKAARRLQYPPEYSYFNAGVLVINVKYWRENNITGKLFDYIEKYHDIIRYHEQDALNGLLYEKCLRLDCKWNMLSGFYIRNLKSVRDIENGVVINNYKVLKEHIKIEMHDPAVVHFASKPKPWDPGCYHPLKGEYYRYLKFTPWNFFREPSLIMFLIKNPGTLPGFIKRILIKIKSNEFYFRF